MSWFGPNQAPHQQQQQPPHQLSHHQMPQTQFHQAPPLSQHQQPPPVSSAYSHNQQWNQNQQPAAPHQQPPGNYQSSGGGAANPHQLPAQPAWNNNATTGSYFKPADLNQNYSQPAGAGPMAAQANDGWGDWGDDWAGGGGGGVGGGGETATNNNNHTPAPAVDNNFNHQQQLPPPPQQHFYGHPQQQQQQQQTLYSTTANYPAPPPVALYDGIVNNQEENQPTQIPEPTLIADSFSNSTDSWNWGNAGAAASSVDSNANQVELIRKPLVFNKMSTTAVRKTAQPESYNNTNQPDDMKSQNYGAHQNPPPVAVATVKEEPPLPQQFSEQSFPGEDLDPLDVALMQMNNPSQSVGSAGGASAGSTSGHHPLPPFNSTADYDHSANFFQPPSSGGISLPNSTGNVAVVPKEEIAPPPTEHYGAAEHQDPEIIPKSTTPFSQQMQSEAASNQNRPIQNQPPPPQIQSFAPPTATTAVNRPPPIMPPPSSSPMSLGAKEPATGNPFKRAGAPVHRNSPFSAPPVPGFNPPAAVPPSQPTIPPEPTYQFQVSPAAAKAAEIPLPAPHNNDDRNEYLQTDQLSEESAVSGTLATSTEPGQQEPMDHLPPPGLSRLVLGEPEAQNYSPAGGNPAQAGGPASIPPPGLDRMVPGTDLEGNADMGLQREADGQDDDVSALGGGSGNYPQPQVPQVGHERHLYRVPGEGHQQASGGPPPSRVVTGDENALPFVQPTAAVGHGNDNLWSAVGASIPIGMHQELEESRDLQLPVDGENSGDDDDGVRFNRQRGELIERDGPIEGENAGDEIISSGGAMGTAAPMAEVADLSGDGEGVPTGGGGVSQLPPPPPPPVRKETSTGEDSEKDRGSYYKSKGGGGGRRNVEEKGTGSLRRKPKPSDRYDSESEGSDRREEGRRQNYDRSYASERRDRGEDRDGRKRRGVDEAARHNRSERTDRRHGERRDEEYELRYGREERRSKRHYDEDREEPSRRRDRDGGDAKRAEKERQYRKERDRERDRDQGREDRREYRDDRRYPAAREKERRYEYDDERYNRSGSRNTDRSRDPRYAAGAGYYGQTYGYDHYAYYTQQQQQQMQYYENLRRTNPQAYAEWYRKYYMQMQAGGAVPGGGLAASAVGAAVGPADMPTDGRESVHSGRSSTNDKDRYSRMTTGAYHHHHHQPYGDYPRPGGSAAAAAMGMDGSLMMESSYGGVGGGGALSSLNHSYSFSQYLTQPGQQQHQRTGHHLQQASFYSQSEFSDSRHLDKDGKSSSQRMTPFKFTSEHSQVSIGNGLMVCIKPKYTQHGVVNLVKILNVGALTSDMDADKRLLAVYPGPLVRSVTHKKTVIEFCEERIRTGPCPPPATTRENSLLRSHANSMTSLCSVTQNSNQQSMSAAAAAAGPANAQFKASYNLLWNLLILLLRQNGTIVGTDISELLIKNASEFPTTKSNLVIIESVAEKPAENRPEGGDASLSDINSDESSNEVQADELPVSKASGALSEAQITDKFRDYLLYGNVTEALDWATEHNLWGHALFLASKLDRRSHANVMMKFANKLALNDPLQTLYQLMSLRTPAFVTSVVDRKWGDWRPHLAMILSNTSQRPELDRRAITTLGDSLGHIGDVYGAHFCYLMAQVGFGRYERWTAETAATAPKLVLLGASLAKPFREFAATEAIIMTEIYEYAVTLNDEAYSIGEFQPYKFTLATRLLDYGHQLKAFLYMEQLAKHIKRDAQRFEPSLIGNVCDFADRLRYYDPVQEKTAGGGGMEEQLDSQDSEGDNQRWIQDLKDIQSQLQVNPTGSTYNNSQQVESDLADRGSSIDRQFTEINQQFNQLNLQYQTYETQANPQPNDYYGQQQQQQQSQGHEGDPPPQSQYLQPDYNNQGDSMTDAAGGNHQEAGQPAEASQYDPYGYQQQQDQYQTQSLPPQGNFYNPAAYDNGSYAQPLSIGGEQQPQDGGYDYYGQQQQQTTPEHLKRSPDTSTHEMHNGGGGGGLRLDDYSHPLDDFGLQTTDDFGGNGQATGFAAAQSETDYEPPKPQISMPSSMSHRPGFFDDEGGDGRRPGGGGAGQSQAAAAKGDKDKGLPTGGKGEQQQSSGWFGGIFGKFGKPKNQMILPDDKNPTIVWDPDKKRWINTDEGETEAEAFKPPPKMSELNLPQQQQQQPPMVPMPQQQQQQQPPQVQAMPPTSSNFMSAPAPVPVPTPMMSVGRPQGAEQEEASAVDGANKTAKNNLQSNQFKLQRNRTLKKSYVDVFNPSGAPMKPMENIMAPSQVPTIPQSGFFIPGAPMGGQ